MRTKLFWMIGLIVSLTNCEHDPSPVQSVSSVSSSECKKYGLKGVFDHPSSEDCIQYKWINGDTLLIKHVNAGFNCCPQGFRAELKVSGDTLVISESENSSLCDCSCLFDLDYHLTGITKGTWWIRVNEQYVQQSDAKKILFRIELLKDTESEFCVTRTGYPWKI